MSGGLAAVAEASPTSSLIPNLVPADVMAEEAFTDAFAVVLYPEEEAVLENALDERRREFETVRLCARRALTRLGVQPGPLVPGVQRAPLWPVGVVGSMTHCEGYRAAAVGRVPSVASVGIDAELHMPLPDGVLGVIAREDERSAIASLSASHPAIAWDRLLFSAKESVFKAWFPLTGQWLDFTDCSITLQPDEFTFTAALRVPGPVVRGRRRNTFPGRWSSSGTLGRGHLGTAVTIQ
ncbi:4'-phosphopantetheinyl transferase family protein [Arthrobacter zhaoguopingii]|uniref:4'-phosphopantetheinyl transferase family protein n=1 Tax=Arthrobacter zhaoguopingii TaxID=2681491 RepID=UPI00191510C4|nr:4'-phosphopantetheinyl transferase superfamily protein [Arthrobacter zhaoguopingii]